MAITTYQVQNILRTYGKQLSRGKRASTRMSSARAQAIADQVRISSSAKRRQVINTIAEEIITQLTTQTIDRSSMEQEALDILSDEYGQTLEVYENSDGSLGFAIVDSNLETGAKELSSEESDDLARRLNNITQSIVDRNML